MNALAGEGAGTRLVGTYRLRWSDGRVFGPASIEAIRAWGREGRVPPDSILEGVEGGEPIPVTTDSELARIVQAPPTERSPARDFSGMGQGPSLIPTRNPQALTAYYLAVASLLPVFGLVLAPLAIVLGVGGLRRYRADPAVSGVTHAWIAIIGGSIMLAIQAVVAFGVVFAILS